MVLKMVGVLFSAFFESFPWDEKQGNDEELNELKQPTSSRHLYSFLNTSPFTKRPVSDPGSDVGIPIIPLSPIFSQLQTHIEFSFTSSGVNIEEPNATHWNEQRLQRDNITSNRYSQAQGKRDSLECFGTSNMTYLTGWQRIATSPFTKRPLSDLVFDERLSIYPIASEIQRGLKFNFYSKGVNINPIQPNDSQVEMIQHGKRDSLMRWSAWKRVIWNFRQPEKALPYNLNSTKALPIAPPIATHSNDLIKAFPPVSPRTALNRAAQITSSKALNGIHQIQCDDRSPHQVTFLFYFLNTSPFIKRPITDRRIGFFPFSQQFNRNFYLNRSVVDPLPPDINQKVQRGKRDSLIRWSASKRVIWIFRQPWKSTPCNFNSSIALPQPLASFHVNNLLNWTTQIASSKTPNGIHQIQCNDLHLVVFFCD